MNDVERSNYSPKGSVESRLVKCDDTLNQANLPPHSVAEVTEPVAVGNEASVLGTVEEQKGDHPIYPILM
jgi:hypothetical protein